MSDARDAAEAANTTIGAIGEIVAIAKDSPDARTAGVNLAKSASIVTEALRHVLLPVKALNFLIQGAEDYFDRKMGQRLASKLADTPDDDIIPPKASVAGPAIEGLQYAFDEPELEDMFTSLIASAMNRTSADDVHPAFAQVVKQLDPQEASLLRHVLRGERVRPIAEIRTRPESWNVLERNVLYFESKSTGEPVLFSRLASWVDNWSRLGLVDVDYANVLKPDRYTWVQEHPQLTRHTANFPQVTFGKGNLKVTDFGIAFGKAIGVLG